MHRILYSFEIWERAGLLMAVCVLELHGASKNFDVGKYIL